MLGYKRLITGIMLIVKYNFEDYEIKGLKWIKDFINGKISFEKYE